MNNVSKAVACHMLDTRPIDYATVLAGQHIQDKKRNWHACVHTWERLALAAERQKDMARTMWRQVFDFISTSGPNLSRGNSLPSPRESATIHQA